MKIRVVSAVIAAALLIATYFVWEIKGLYAICSLIAIGCAFEYARLAFPTLRAPALLQWLFVLLCSACYFVFAFAPAASVGAIGVAAVVFCSMTVMTIPSVREVAAMLQSRLQIQGAAVLGFAYCGLFPALAVRSLELERGQVWLFGLLAIVFSGDTFAYLVGRAMGRTKLLESVSPKKTVEGSMGGLVGSGVAGAILGLFFLTEYPLWAMILLALATGAFAQVGDLFESLIKRVADVKDSGRIMPGHGGFLDRVDGVIFAAPIYFVLARFLV